MENYFDVPKILGGQEPADCAGADEDMTAFLNNGKRGQES